MNGIGSSSGQKFWAEQYNMVERTCKKFNDIYPVSTDNNGKEATSYSTSSKKVKTKNRGSHRSSAKAATRQETTASVAVAVEDKADTKRSDTADAELGLQRLNVVKFLTDCLRLSPAPAAVAPGDSVFCDPTTIRSVSSGPLNRAQMCFHMAEHSIIDAMCQLLSLFPHNAALHQNVMTAITACLETAQEGLLGLETLEAVLAVYARHMGTARMLVRIAAAEEKQAAATANKSRDTRAPFILFKTRSCHEVHLVMLAKALIRLCFGDVGAEGETDPFDNTLISWVEPLWPEMHDTLIKDKAFQQFLKLYIAPEATVPLNYNDPRLQVMSERMDMASAGAMTEGKAAEAEEEEGSSDRDFDNLDDGFDILSNNAGQESLAFDWGQVDYGDFHADFSREDVLVDGNSDSDDSDKEELFDWG
ncbi:hypothetical protein KIPB_003218 [Kipferlia bialata]|uniref:Uncharacterized protein n=1 Tax=Kipferlia bialata TaxID=797122 RepID=A0A9K3CTR2_9EUKA|nr:hypothetical protein KIPB_003218 [Kipferlia bialata]|eukprot:g3218.t1